MDRNPDLMFVQERIGNDHDYLATVGCRRCGKKIKKKSLENHMRMSCPSRNKDKYRCTAANCGQTFKGSLEKNMHIYLEHHKPQLVQVPKAKGANLDEELLHIQNCTSCTAKINPKKGLKTHKRACTGKYHCLFEGCTYSTHNSSMYRKVHYVRVHSDAGKIIYKYNNKVLSGDIMISFITDGEMELKFSNPKDGVQTVVKVNRQGDKGEQCSVQMSMCYKCKNVVTRSLLKEHLLECL